MTESIFLIGLPGSGKSTVGRILADSLRMTFVDTDEEVLQIAKRDRPELSTLLELYAAVPVEEFKKYEAVALRALVETSGRVIATGGGFVSHQPSFDLVKQTSRVFFLDCPIEILARRIGQMSPRPMFQDKGIPETLRHLETERRGKYLALATAVVDAENEPAVVAKAISKL